MNFDYTLEPGKQLIDRNLKKDGKPLISIITPYYNGGKYICQTFRCIENQTFPWFEWIIVDDGSTDEYSLYILDELAELDCRIRIIHKENGGISSARNIGITEAKTDFIFPLDCDDLDEPTYLEYCWWMLQKNPEAAWAYATSCGFEGQEYLWDVPFDPITMKTQNIVTPTALIRKSWLVKAGCYDETISKHYNEDWHLWLRLLALGAYPVQATQEYLHWYRRSENGVFSIVEKDSTYAEINKKAIQKIAECVVFPHAPVIYPHPISGKWKKPMLSSCDDCIFTDHKKIHIAFIVPYFEMGGADKFNLDLIHGLDKNRFEVGIITTVPSQNPWLQECRKDVADIFNLPNFVEQEDYAEFVSYYIKSRQIDILFISNSYHGYYMLPWLRQQFPKLAIVDYVHMEEWYWRGGGYARTSSSVGAITEKTYTCNSATTQIMINHFLKEPQKMETVHIGVNIDYFYKDVVRSGISYKLLNIKRERPIVLFICRLHPQKRPFLMLKIAEQVRQKINDVAFVVVGDGPQKNELKTAVHNMTLEHTVYFAGAHKDVRPFYQDAKLTLICSLKEGLSLTAYESCAMGIPVVTSDVGGQKDLIDDTVGAILPCLQTEEEDLDVRIFSEEEVQSYVDAVVDILSNHARWQAMSKACRSRIEKKFTTQNMIRHFESEFEWLVSDASLAKKRQSVSNALKLLSPMAADYLTVELQEQAAEENCGFRYYDGGGDIYDQAYTDTDCVKQLKTQINDISSQLHNHEEVLVRHEEVVNRHEEVVNRHEQVVNDDWLWLKDLTRRVGDLEHNFLIRVVNKLFKLK